MTIIRDINGKEMCFDLTPNEAFEAYYAQLRNDIVDQILYDIEYDTDDDLMQRYGATAQKIKNLAPKIADRVIEYAWEDIDSHMIGLRYDAILGVLQEENC